MITTDKLEKPDGLPNDSFLIPIWQILTFSKVENFTPMFLLQSVLCFSLCPFNPFSWFLPLDIINNIGCAGQLVAAWLVKVIGEF